MLKDENYINISGWMINRLNLKGNELLTFAIVYGFSQDGKTWYQGSSKYIADALQIARKTAVNSLDALTEKGLIIKKQESTNDATFNRYKVSPQAMQNLHRGYVKVTQGGYVKSTQGGYVKVTQGGYVKSTHSNTNKNTNKNTSKNTKGNNKRVYFPNDEKLNEAYNNFLDMRKKMRKANTDRSIDLQIKRLEKLSADAFGTMDNDKAIEIINQSIEGEWLTFYPLKEEKQKQTGGIDWSKV